MVRRDLSRWAAWQFRHRAAPIIATACLAAHLMAGGALASETETVATSENGQFGSLGSGDLGATYAADDVSERIIESKDATGQYRLQWDWHFDGVTLGESYQLRLRAQATNSKRGMDHYDFSIRGAEGQWTSLGTAAQTTMTDYAWEVPAELVTGTITVRAVDTNTSDDPRRANQLWVDRLVIVSRTSAGDPGGDGGGGDGGDGSGGTATRPQTDKAIVGYYPSWAIYNARKYWVRYIPFERITHVNYAFANVDPGTLEVTIGDAFAELTNRKDPETDNGLPAGNLYQLTHYRDVGHDGPAYAHVKIIISVGGWTWSENFSDAALSPESRWRFAESLKTFVETYDLDGADLDWEFPTGDPADCGEDDNVCRAIDPVNHALLIMACRAKLDELGPDKELSIAVPANAESVARIAPPLVDNSRLVDGGGTPLVIFRNPNSPSDFETVDLLGPSAADMLDYLHVMNYDHVGAAWEDTTRHHAPLYGYEGEMGDPAEGDPDKSAYTKANAHFAVQAYRHVQENYEGFDPDNPDPLSALGTIEPAKITLGVPLYGRGFKSLDPGDWDGFEGLFQFTDASARRRTPKGTWDGGQWGNSGVYAYWDLLLQHGGDAEASQSNVIQVGPPATARPYGAYLLEDDLFVGFDSPTSIADKMRYIVDEGLGGVMFWDFPGDLSQAQVDAGLPGAAAAYPDRSLVHRITGTLEALQPAP